MVKRASYKKTKKGLGVFKRAPNPNTKLFEVPHQEEVVIENSSKPHKKSQELENFVFYTFYICKGIIRRLYEKGIFEEYKFKDDLIFSFCVDACLNGSQEDDIRLESILKRLDIMNNPENENSMHTLWLVIAGDIAQKEYSELDQYQIFSRYIYSIVYWIHMTATHRINTIRMKREIKNSTLEFCNEISRFGDDSDILYSMFEFTWYNGEKITRESTVF